MSSAHKASTQESFNQGVVAALHALKTALQASPGFNNDALVHVVKGLINSPSDQLDVESFNWPILALLHDHVLDANGNVTTKQISLD